MKEILWSELFFKSSDSSGAGCGDFFFRGSRFEGHGCKIIILAEFVGRGPRFQNFELELFHCFKG